MNRDELLAMPEADAVTALAAEANWPADITGAVRAEWHKMTAEERLVWIHNTEEIRRTMDVDVFRQWQGRGPTKPKHDSIPRWYKQCWRDNARRST